ncbi:MAG: MspA family porin, partial [Mycobacterium sp.]
MNLLGKVSGWARRSVLAVGALVMTLVALFATAATAHAGLDDEMTLVDGKGRTLRIQEWDTFLNGVFPLDRNRLTR